MVFIQVHEYLSESLVQLICSCLCLDKANRRNLNYMALNFLLVS